MLTVLQEITEQFVSAELGTLEILMDQSAAKVRRILPINLYELYYSLKISSSAVPIPKVECTTDKDCPSRESCLNEKCKDPCQAIAPCAPNAECTVHNTLPLRTMSCSCLPGFTGKGDEHCDRISKLKKSEITKKGPIHVFFNFSIGIPEPVGCQSDQECSRNEACNFGDCVNPCASSNPCSSNAECYNENHKANCRCPPGFTGDAFRRCTPSE